MQIVISLAVNIPLVMVTGPQSQLDPHNPWRARGGTGPTSHMWQCWTRRPFCPFPFLLFLNVLILTKYFYGYNLLHISC
jgi:hypothetical protein